MALEVKRNGRRITVPSRALESAAGKLSGKNLAKVLTIAELAMRSYLYRVTGALIAKHSAPYSSTRRAANVLQSRSGAGLQALRAAFTRRRSGTIEGVVSLPFHMVQQEFGGVIRAKSGRYLSIPLPAALNPDGMPKKRSAREWKNTFIVKGKRGTLVICQKRGKQTIPLYVLKPTVRIAPRLGLRKQMRGERLALQKDIARRIRELIVRNA